MNAMTLSRPKQVLFVVLSLLWLNACDMAVDSGNSANPEIEIVRIDQGDGSNFIVYLDTQIKPTRRVFDDMDDLYHFMDSVDASGQVSLNKDLYLRLKHALFPNEIAALDIEGVAIVGKYKYVITEEAVNRTSTEANEESLEVETYHGVSGDAYLNEFAVLARNISNIDELKDFMFKDPEIKSLYTKMKNTASSNKITNINRVLFETKETNQFPFDNPTTGQYYTSSSGIHDRGYNLWNQSIGRFSRRALAYTGLVFRPTNTITWYQHNYGYYGRHLSSYTTTNFVTTRVNGGKGHKTCTGTYECSVEAKRKGKTGAESWHSSGYRPPSIGKPPGAELPDSYILPPDYDMDQKYVR